MAKENSGQGRSVLLVSYYFAPMGGPGVQRYLKFCKYLERLGWNVHVLTVKNIRYHVHDRSLETELPPSVNVHRARSADPLRLSYLLSRHRRTSRQLQEKPGTTLDSPGTRMYRWIRDRFLFPDAQVAWAPFAIREGQQLVQEHSIDVILAGFGPPSDLIVGARIAEKTNKPTVFDFRDGWTDNPDHVMPSRLHKRAHAWLERKLINQCDAIIACSSRQGEAFKLRYPNLGSPTIIPNGYDLEDLPTRRLKKSPSDLRLVYMGSLYPMHERNFEAFCKAIACLDPNVRQHLQVCFVGNAYSRAHETVREHGCDNEVSFVGYLPHAEALDMLAEADAALLFVRAGDKHMVTGKVFEYMAVAPRILACCDVGSPCSDVLREANMHQWLVNPEDPSEIAAAIEGIALQRREEPPPRSISQFNREQQSLVLSALLEKVASRNA